VTTREVRDGWRPKLPRPPTTARPTLAAMRVIPIVVATLVAAVATNAHADPFSVASTTLRGDLPPTCGELDPIRTFDGARRAARSRNVMLLDLESWLAGLP
jgi:hypothetical protein